MLQGHLVGSLLPIPEVEGKEGSRYPRHRWTDSVMCSYFQIRRRTLLTGYFKAQERKKQEKERKKTDNPREGWEDGTPPPHRDFKEGTVWC